MGNTSDDRTRRLAGLLDSPTHQDGYAYDDAVARPQAGERRREALRAIDRAASSRSGSRRLPAAAATKLEMVVFQDEIGWDSAYISAAADPAYLSAFPRLLRKAAGSPTAELGMSVEEREAVRRMENVLAHERAMGIGSGPAGGFAVPIVLDPSVLPSDGLSVSPLREIARVETIAGNEWRGVSSDGVTASYDAEAQEVSDDTPTLAQPIAKVQKAQAFVPYSIEIEQDWAAMQRELIRMLADAKTTLENEKFLVGLGEASTEPEGLLIGGTIDVTTATSGTLVGGDVYALQEALPPRWQENATFVMALATANRIYREWNPTGTEPPLFNPDRTQLLSRPWREYSNMDTAISAGKQPVVYGDFKQFLIADRIGMTVEVVAHLIGANRRPTGQRGLYAYWRNTSKVLVNNAFRTLRIKT